MSGTVSAKVSTIGLKNQMSISPLAGQPAPKAMLVDVSRLEQEYLERKPHVTDPNQWVIRVVAEVVLGFLRRRAASTIA